MDIKKGFTVALYIIILFMIPLFIDYLFRITIRKKRQNQIRDLAMDRAQKKGKSLIIFNGPDRGVVYHLDDKKDTSEEFEGNIDEIINHMSLDSSVMIVSETLEYVPDIQKTVDTLLKVTGGNLYVVGVEKNSPHVLWNYKIINILDEPYYLPESNNIKWSPPNKIQTTIQRIYSYMFVLLPYDFFAYNPIDNV
jgi:hypothetical protein